MTSRSEALASRITVRFADTLTALPSRCGELTYEVEKGNLLDVAASLRDEADFRFETLIDVCGVDYLAYGQSEWDGSDATNTGFSRAAAREMIVPPADAQFEPRRFAVVYHLLSVSGNYRLRLRTYTGTGNPPVVPSVIGIWQAADWYERETVDLFGILFDGHPDLRRLLTDYGFIGHPFRKDFPVSGNVEVRFDPEKGRVVYQPVTIEPRVLVPRIIRDDNRYQPDLKDRPGNG